MLIRFRANIQYPVPNKMELSKLNRKLLLLLPGRVESELVTPFNHSLDNITKSVDSCRIKQ